MCDMDMCECVFQDDSVSLQTEGKRHQIFVEKKYVKML